ncbi:MAG: hypothetical protein HYT43_00720 [Candidatus Taylorbacteria bacterium]|nr:hypothetical protein [Candidatus Taylorbacteria bacterium]
MYDIKPARAGAVKTNQAPISPGRGRWFKFRYLVVGMLILVLAVAGFWLFGREEKPAAASGDIVERVAKLILLPSDETPTVAAVSDVNKLKNQPFFEKAKDGFYVLIYSKSKKAILYDPVKNQIVEVGALTLPDSAKKP